MEGGRAAYTTPMSLLEEGEEIDEEAVEELMSSPMDKAAAIAEVVEALKLTDSDDDESAELDDASEEAIVLEEGSEE